jgi:hypothetical protein
MVTLPESFKELQALVYLEMHHCPNLVDVQGLPWSLESLGLGNCPKLIDIPSLRNLYLLKSLILCNCTSLTQLQDLESLITLERMNLSGCTMLQNVPNLNHNGALGACYLSGSYISMPIDSDWLKVRFKLEIELSFANLHTLEHNEKHDLSNLYTSLQFKFNSWKYLC